MGCATTANFATDLVLATALNTLSGVANGLVNVEGHTVTGVTDAGSYGAAGVNRDTVAAVKDTFNTHFPNGAGTVAKISEIEAVCILALKNAGQGADTTAKFAQADVNPFYYQAGFYDTVTPQFNQDALHANSLEAADVQESDMM